MQSFAKISVIILPFTHMTTDSSSGLHEIELNGEPTEPKDTPQAGELLLDVAISCAFSTINAPTNSPKANRRTSSIIANNGASGEQIQDLLTVAQELIPCSLFARALSLTKSHLEVAAKRLNLAKFRKASSSISSSPTELFSNLLDTQLIWKTGSIYTPSWLSVHIASELCLLAPHISTQQSGYCLDPACGSGNLLVALLSRVALSGATQRTLIRLVSEQLIGIDINKDAILLAEFLLLSTLARYSPTIAPRDMPSLFGNTLIHDDYLFPSPNSVSKRFSSPESIDVIIGNPPFGLSRDGRLPEYQIQSLKSRFPNELSGNISSYLPFLVTAFASLKPTGVMAFITPNSWLGISSGQKLRSSLLKRGAIYQIETHPPRTFDCAGVETVTIYLTKTNSHNQIKLVQFGSSSEREAGSGIIQTRNILETTGQTIPLWWDEELDELISVIKERSTLIRHLPNLFRPLIAMQEYAVGKGSPPQEKFHSLQRMFHDDAPQGDSWVPFLLGREVDRYQVNFSENYLNYGPWLADPGHRTHYEQPRVVIREIVAGLPQLLRCCAVDYPLFYNRSLLHIIVTAPERGSHHPTKSELALALSALLNSSLMSAYLLLFGRKTQRRLFPKLVCEDLKDIPIPDKFEAHSAELAQIVSGNSGEERDRAVDDYIRKLYGLTNLQFEKLIKLCNAARFN